MLIHLNSEKNIRRLSDFRKTISLLFAFRHRKDKKDSVSSSLSPLSLCLQWTAAKACCLTTCSWLIWIINYVCSWPQDEAICSVAAGAETHRRPVCVSLLRRP